MTDLAARAAGHDARRPGRGATRHAHTCEHRPGSSHAPCSGYRALGDFLAASPTASGSNRAASLPPNPCSPPWSAPCAATTTGSALRREAAVGPDDPALARLVGELTARDEDFRTWPAAAALGNVRRSCPRPAARPGRHHPVLRKRRVHPGVRRGPPSGGRGQDPDSPGAVPGGRPGGTGKSFTLRCR
ncbi:hypothetical protein [Streptomyces roseirectus]|uniref:MmyB family transcriptional regulator n=1 Tax=Streptomyces roseirectus TaxID=2768066 RepID=UPI003CCE35DE